MKVSSLSHRRTGGVAVATLALLLVGALSAGPALADTELGHTGKVGHHYLNDQSGDAGTTCTYVTNGQVMLLIEVRAPNIWARDRTSSRDHQRVGWRFVVKRKRDTSTKLTTLYKSSIVKATAYDDQSAYFEGRGFQPSLPIEQPGHSSRYQVRIQMFWYRKDGTVMGKATHRVDTYLEVFGASQTEFAYCPTTFTV